MLRSAIPAGVVLVLAAAVALAADVHGTVKKADPEAGTLTISVKVDKETMEKEFAIAPSTKVVVYDGKDKRQWTGKKALTDEAIKEGRRVLVKSDGDGKVVHVQVGMPPGQEAHGILKKADTEGGILTVALKAKGEAASKDFTVGPTTRFVIFDGKDKREATGKDALRDEALKEGVEVMVVSDGGKVIRVRIGTPPKKE